MKAIDTPVLLSILHDTPAARELLKGLRGEELATTELNMFELKRLAAEGPRSQHDSREGALVRLRRRLTVLPISSDSVREAGRYLKTQGGRGDYQPLVWGTLSAAGCAEWITTRAFAPPKGTFPFKVRII